jgi:L-serine dehydratase
VDLKLGGEVGIVFDEARDIVWAGHERLPQHPNGLTFTAFDAAGVVLAERTYFSIGGGFVRDESEMGRNTPPDEGPRAPASRSRAAPTCCNAPPTPACRSPG